MSPRSFPEAPILNFRSMKLDKAIVQRRLDLMAAEGVVCQISNGSSYDAELC